MCWSAYAQNKTAAGNLFPFSKNNLNVLEYPNQQVTDQIKLHQKSMEKSLIPLYDSIYDWTLDTVDAFAGVISPAN